MIALAWLVACGGGGGGWTVDWSGDWSGEIALETGNNTPRTATIAFSDLSYQRPAPNWSDQQGAWAIWSGLYGVDNPAGEYVEVWQCEDEDACTSPGVEVVTGQFLVTGWAGSRSEGSYWVLRIVGTRDGDDASGDAQYDGFYEGTGRPGAFGPVTLHRD